MPKAEAGSAKAVGNAMKARGLTKLRFYCQVCQKANRDEHAFKMHCESESHMRQLAVVAQNANKAIDDFSQQFLDEFVSLLSRRFGTARIKANQVYQEYIQERHHLHMNATKWVTLTEFVKHLGREGIVHVEENEKGWFISWVDNSPAALKRQAALQKMERQKMDDEGRQRKRLQEQIEKARAAESSAESEVRQGDAGLKRDVTTGPIKLGISLKAGGGGGGVGEGEPAQPSEQAASGSQPRTASSGPLPAAKATTPFRMGASPFKAAGNPLRAGSNPLKAGGGGNPLKGRPATQPTPASSSSSSSSAAARNQPRTMAERIMLEENAQRDKRRSGPMPSSQPGVKRIRM